MTGVTFPRVVRAEWTKLAGLRSTWLVLAAVSALAVGFAGVIGRQVDTSQPISPAKLIAFSFLPLDFLILALGVFGVLQMTGEYGSGRIVAVLAAVPTRWPVLAAKAVALVLLVGPLLLADAVLAFLACQAGLGPVGLGLTDPGVPAAVAGAAGCATLIGLLGVGLGAVVRHTAGAVSTLFAGLYLVPLLLGPALPHDLAPKLMKYTPTLAGQAMYGSDGPYPMLGAAAGAAVLAAWALTLLAAGWWALSRRDA